ncbi:hypothetical protein TNCV_1781201 [Trichonephila clavipes]|nr:hypothetical protein TNCV_1781201 [Trichonephila clavipes]
METARQNPCNRTTIVELKQEPALITDPNFGCDYRDISPSNERTTGTHKVNVVIEKSEFSLRVNDAPFPENNGLCFSTLIAILQSVNHSPSLTRNCCIVLIVYLRLTPWSERRRVICEKTCADSVVIWKVICEYVVKIRG